MPQAPQDENKVGKYTLLNRLTMGGMAELFLGYTKGPGGFRKYVVIKRILPDAAANEHFVKMFLDEARITAGFSHSNIVQVYDLGEDQQGLYVVMEFVPGQNLNQIVNACADQQAVFPLGFSLSVLHECASALHYAHTYKKPTGEAYPVIHRDVAQKNIMVTYDGQVRLLDFGIAKARGALSRTSVGTVKGTAGYMSPEQVRGDQIDGRSDVFALGVVLWESCTGRRLFSADSETQEMRMILDAPIASPSTIEASVPEAVSDVVLRALARSRDDRYATAKDLAKALQQAAEPLLFDVEERANFMRERFAGRIAATQKLFDISDAAANSAQYQEVVKSFQEKVRHGNTTVKVSAGVHSAKQAAMSEADQQLARLELDAERLVAPPPNRTGFYVLLLVVFLAAAAVVNFAVKTVRTDPNVDPTSGLRRFPGEEAPDEGDPNDRGPKPINLRPDVPIAPPPQQLMPPPEPPAPDPSAVGVTPDTTPIALPPPVRPEAQKPPAGSGTLPNQKKPKATGAPTKVTLGLLPSGGTVMLNGEVLCKDRICTLMLQRGLQRLMVIGPDHISRDLPIQVGAEPKSMRVVIDELPPVK